MTPDAVDATVLLIEAGPSDAAVASIEVQGAWASLMEGPYDWSYAYAPGPHVGGRTIPIPRGRVLGSSSSTNAMLWFRGQAADDGAWAAAGATGWTFDALLPYLRRSWAASPIADREPKAEATDFACVIKSGLGRFICGPSPQLPHGRD